MRLFRIRELRKLGYTYPASPPPLDLPEEVIDFYTHRIERVFMVSNLEASWALYYVCLLCVSTTPSTPFHQYLIHNRLASAMPFSTTPIRDLLIGMTYGRLPEN